MKVQNSGSTTIRPRNIIGVLLILGLAGGSAMAGDLYPPGPPAPTMKNLQDIHDQASRANRAVGGGNSLLFFPHVLERAGSVATTQYTFDTTIYLLATGGQVGQGLEGGGLPGDGEGTPNVTVHLYLYSSNGDLATASGGSQVANPATFVVGPDNPKATISLESLFQDAGGFASPIFLGYAILSISSGDWNDVIVDGFLVNSHTGPNDLIITPLEAVRVKDPAAGATRNVRESALRNAKPSGTENNP